MISLATLRHDWKTNTTLRPLVRSAVADSTVAKWDRHRPSRTTDDSTPKIHHLGLGSLMGWVAVAATSQRPRWALVQTMCPCRRQSPHVLQSPQLPHVEDFLASPAGTMSGMPVYLLLQIHRCSSLGPLFTQAEPRKWAKHHSRLRFRRTSRLLTHRETSALPHLRHPLARVGLYAQGLLPAHRQDRLPVRHPVLLQRVKCVGMGPASAQASMP